jgi:NIPSNAP
MGDQLDDGFHESTMSAPTCCPVIELRQYTLKAGMREALIELFEREFVESQEALGITLIGQFRDLDSSDRFVWLRGFADMPARQAALEAFYGGPIWKAHREAANDTMIDSDNVLLLRPARLDSGFSLENFQRQAAGAAQDPPGFIATTICHLGDGTVSDFVDFFEGTIQPALTRAGVSILAYFVTENHPNTFPTLPVRESANVFVWFSIFPGATAGEMQAAVLADSAPWPPERLEILRLRPTPRSRLHG